MRAGKHRWDDVQAFLAVARSGRLTSAARAMAIEHTTLSRRIDRLEASLGFKLFDRRPTGYSLTPQGALLLPHAEELESRAISIWSDHFDVQSALVGTIRIGSPEAFGTFFLAEIIGGLTAANPGLTVELVAMPRSFSLSQREADLAIGLSRPTTGRLHARKLTDYALGLYGSADYLARNGAPVDKGDLRKHRFVGYIDELVFAPELDYYASALPGVSPTIRISNVITQMAAVAGGAGLCILPCFMADRNPALSRVLPQAISIFRTYWLLTHSDTHRERRIKSLSDFISSSIAARQDLFLPN